MAEREPLDRGLEAAFGHSISLREEHSAIGGELPIDPKGKEGVRLPDGKGHYQLLGEIARGGMGVVLKGYDADLGRDLALKVLHERYQQDDAVLQRFVEEAQIGGQLQHPGIVPVYELGRMADQRPYFTMKLVKGKTLGSLLLERESPQDDRRRFLAIFEAVCQTMAYAHSRGVIHRDLKPGNIMVGAFGEVQVVDWGLAKVMPRGGVEEEQRASLLHQASVIQTVRSDPETLGTHSIAGSVLGTPAYMPPEQARGEVAALDERADVFSLGAILCEIVTGAPPYPGPTRAALERAATADLREATQRLDACGADEELVAIAKRCLAPAATARPKDAEALAKLVTAYLASVEDRAKQAQLDAAEARVKAIEERRARKLTLALAVSILATLTVGVGGWWWLDQQERERVDTLRDQVNLALADARHAQGAQDWPAARAALARAEAHLASGEAPESLAGDVARAKTEIGGAADEAERLAAQVAENEALLAALLDVRRPDGDRDYPTDWKVVGQAYRTICDEHRVTLDESDPSATAAAITSRGLGVAFATSLDEWAWVCDQALDPERAAFLRTVAARVDPDLTRGRLRDAIVAEDLDGLRSLAARDDVQEQPAATLWLLANALRTLRDYRGATEILRRATKNHPGDFVIHLSLARVLGAVPAAKLAQWAGSPAAEEAARHCAAAIALRPESIEARHEFVRVLSTGHHQPREVLAQLEVALERFPDDAHLLYHLGLAREALDDPAGAADDYRRSIEIDPDVAVVHYNLGVVLARLGDPKGAVVEYRRAIEIDPGQPGRHYNLGTTLLVLGDSKGAVIEFRREIQIDPGAWNAHNNLGLALSALGDREEAVIEFRRAAQLDPDNALPRYNLGDALARRGDLEGAAAEYRTATRIDPSNAIGLLNLGLALASLGDLEGAAVEFRRALDIDPGLATSRAALVAALWELGDLEGIVLESRRALEIDPKNLTVLNQLAWILATAEDPGLRDPEEAVTFARRAVEIAPWLGAVHDTLGVALYRNGQWAGAASTLTEATSLLPGGGAPSTWLFLAMAHHQLGNAEDAATWYRKAIEWRETGEPDAELARFFAEARDTLGAADDG